MAINGTSTDTPLSIPDNTPGGTTSNITVTPTGNVDSFSYSLTVNHPRPGDLTVSLSDGINTVIVENSDFPFNNWVNEGGNTYTSSGSPTTFNGNEVQSTWTANVSDNAAGEIGTLESWSFTIESAMAPGVGDASLSLTAAGNGYLADPWGAAFLSLTASGAGYVRIEGGGSVDLPLTASAAGFVDWVSVLEPFQTHEVYRLIITGEADSEDDLIIGGISSWQATSQADGRSSYLQAVIPAAETVLPDIEARKNGDLIIQKGYVLSDGETRYEEIMRSSFDELRPDRGQRALTITVSGYLSGVISSKGNRTLSGIRSLSSQNAKRRARCDIDLFLKPGMTVTALNETFTASYINYYVTRADKFCEVGER